MVFLCCICTWSILAEAKEKEFCERAKEYKTPSYNKKLQFFSLNTDGCSFSVYFKESLLYEITRLQMEGKKNLLPLHNPEPDMRSSLRNECWAGGV